MTHNLYQNNNDSLLHDFSNLNFLFEEDTPSEDSNPPAEDSVEDTLTEPDSSSTDNGTAEQPDSSENINTEEASEKKEEKEEKIDITPQLEENLGKFFVNKHISAWEQTKTETSVYIINTCVQNMNDQAKINDESSKKDITFYIPNNGNIECILGISAEFTGLLNENFEGDISASITSAVNSTGSISDEDKNSSVPEDSELREQFTNNIKNKKDLINYNILVYKKEIKQRKVTDAFNKYLELFTMQKKPITENEVGIFPVEGMGFEESGGAYDRKTGKIIALKTPPKMNNKTDLFMPPRLYCIYTKCAIEVDKSNSGV